MIRYLFPTLCFTLVAVASFSVWAFGAKLFNSPLSLYTGCAVVFFALGGLSLTPFSNRQSNQPKWTLIWLFPLSFIIFAICWTAGWMTFKSHFGEIMGSAVGLLGMTAILKARLRFERSILEATALVFLFYTIGYYFGEKLYQDLGGLPGKLGWGIGFGAGLGSGLSYLVQLSRSRN